MARQIIFVSGFGDSHQSFYRFLQRVWRSEHAHVYIFGWDEGKIDFAIRFHRFIAYLDSFPASDVLCIVGISAGGAVSVNALHERPDRIVKVVVVSSPLHQYRKYSDAGLIIAIKRAAKAYRSFDDAMKSKITTIFGWYDGVVPINLTRLPGAKAVRVFGFMHAMNIAVATILWRRKLLTLLKK